MTRDEEDIFADVGGGSALQPNIDFDNGEEPPF
jgi:hypothetical protein